MTAVESLHADSQGGGILPYRLVLVQYHTGNLLVIYPYHGPITNTAGIIKLRIITSSTQLNGTLRL